MNMWRAATFAALAVAIVAAAFAIWPVVADAPWEDNAPIIVDDRTDTVRCQGALSFRDSVIEAGRYAAGGVRRGTDRGPGNPGGLRDYDEQLAKGEREIDRYCGN